MRAFRLLGLLALIDWTLLPEGAQTQDLLQWDAFRQCVTCELVPRVVLRLGEREGPGAIESEYAELVGADGRGFMLYLPRVGQEVGLFDEAGAYVRSIGRGGEGPGELRGVQQAAFLEDANILLLDANRRWVRFGAEGHLVGERPSEGPAGPFYLERGDTTAIVFGVERTYEAVGYPLHRVDLRTGRVVRRFGARDPNKWMAGDFFNDRVLGGKSDRNAESVWWGMMGRPHLEEWSFDGTLRRVVTGEFSRLAEEWAGNMTTAAPRPRVLEFGVDALDRLWLLTLVPDPRWKEVPRGLEGSVAREHYNRFWDARLDVFDLGEVLHIGSYTWDEMAVKLLRRGGDMVVYLTEFVTPDWPRMTIYAVDISIPSTWR